jgi:hypothetical protein
MRQLDLSRFDSPRLSLITFSVLLLPIIMAIWFVPWFVTQDGPIHLYNAYLISETVKGHSWVQDVYVVNWTPLPNVLGHLLLTALLQIVSAHTADRLMMTFTSVGLASAALWLRWQVAKWRGMTLASPLAVALALNCMWLWGFYNFLLGACLFAITLGYWWAGREHMGVRWAIILAGLVVLGYLGHLVSSVLTIVGLIILALTTSGPGRLARCGWTAITLTPLVPLGGLYYRLMQNAGELRPVWRISLQNRWSPHAWYQYLEAENPLNLLDSRAFPFIEWTSAWFRLLHASSWVAVGLLLLVIGTLLTRTNQEESPARMYRGWIILTLFLLLGWIVGPSDLGSAHGSSLRMRFFLLALIAIIPVLRLDSKSLHVWGGMAALVVAVALQSAIVWDCALISNRAVSLVIEAKPSVGTGKRIGTLRLTSPARSICDTTYHADALLGIGTRNIVWNNYEAAQYYFPVKFHDERGPSLVRKFDDTVDVKARDAHELLDQWARLLIEHHHIIDTFVVWGTDPGLDAMIAQWYGPEPVFQRGELRVFQHR